MSVIWSISQLERSLPEGGVTTAHWRVVATEGDYTASAYGTASFTPDPTNPDFKPFEDLAEGDVLLWVWGTVDKDATEATLAQQLDLQQNPVSATGTPW